MASIAGPATATCFHHPDQPAIGTCTRCGLFICSADRRLLDDDPYCPSCFSLPEVNYLEAFREEYRNRRDGWTWLVGIGAVVTLGIAGVTLANGQFWFGLVLLADAIVRGAFWLKRPWARPGLIISTVSVGLTSGLIVGTPDALAQSFIPVIIVVFIYYDAHNRLSFGLEVPEHRVRKLWNIYRNNTIARRGFVASLLGLLVPGISIIGLICSIVGLRRVNPNAHPPIGRKGLAIAGIVLGVIGTIEWSAIMLLGPLR